MLSERRGQLPGHQWGPRLGHNWGPRLGHQWGLLHGHGQARLIAEHHTPLAAGIHDELLVETLAVALDCCIAFLHHLCPPVVSRVETVSAGQLEDWLTER